jgi:hypothetical protein
MPGVHVFPSVPKNNLHSHLFRSELKQSQNPTAQPTFTFELSLFATYHTRIAVSLTFFLTPSKMSLVDDKSFEGGAASNGINEACDEENESLMLDAIDSKDVEEHPGGQATSKSNSVRSLRTYFSKSRTVGVLVAIGFVFYLFGIKSEAQLHTTSTS